MRHWGKWFSRLLWQPYIRLYSPGTKHISRQESLTHSILDGPRDVRDVRCQLTLVWKPWSRDALSTAREL